jgi:hypothetical protein
MDQGGVSLSQPYSSKRREAFIVPTPSKCSARADGEREHRVSPRAVGLLSAPTRSAGRCVNGRDATCSGIGLGSLATSVIDRYLIGAEACSRIHPSGNVIVGDGDVATGVCGVARTLTRR